MTAITRSDGFTGQTPNTSWGYGKINALAAMDQLAAEIVRAVFRDTNGSIRMTTYPSASLSNANGVFGSDPAAAGSLTGNLFVTARDTFNSVWTNVFNATTQAWSGWQYGGGTIQGTPAIGVAPNGTSWIAARDSYNSYWLLSYTTSTGYGAWTPLAGVFASDPVLTACADGSLYVVGKDNSDALWSGHYIPGTGFQSFQFGGGAIKGKPSVSCGSDNAAYVVARDNFNSNWAVRVAGNTWGTWFNGGATANIDPRITSLGGSMAVVILDGTGAVWRTTLNHVDRSRRLVTRHLAGRCEWPIVLRWSRSEWRSLSISSTAGVTKYRPNEARFEGVSPQAGFSRIRVM